MAKNLDKADVLSHIVRPRILVYTAILIVITIVAGWFLAHRIPLKVDIFGDAPGAYANSLRSQRLRADSAGISRQCAWGAEVLPEACTIGGAGNHSFR